jgi:hypothetical protein
MSDIINELRERSLRAEQEGEPLALLDEAADEIASLRLTKAERRAIAEAVGAYNDNDDDEECARIAATLHGLLKRTERRS